MRHLLVGVLALVSTSAWGASFDCTRANTPVERQICATPVLSSLDDELADLFAARVQEQASPTRLRDAQRAWIRGRNSCRNAECLRQSYEQRIAELACLDGPSLSSAIGVSTCATARLRVLDAALDAQLKSRPGALADWRASRSERCRKEGQAAGGAPGWQAASALQCEVAATEQRLEALRRSGSR